MKKDKPLGNPTSTLGGAFFWVETDSDFYGMSVKAADGNASKFIVAVILQIDYDEITR